MRGVVLCIYVYIYRRFQECSETRNCWVSFARFCGARAGNLTIQSRLAAASAKAPRVALYTRVAVCTRERRKKHTQQQQQNQKQKINKNKTPPSPRALTTAREALEMNALRCILYISCPLENPR